MEEAVRTADGGRYEIVVRGRLSERFASALPGIELQARPGATALLGEFKDQAQLFGVLQRLSDFGIEVVSVNPVP
jgi:hypothetical protein